MFYKEKIERLERRVRELENRESELLAELSNRRIFMRKELYSPLGLLHSLPSVPAISLEYLQKMQERILNYLNVELKKTLAKTELIKKEG
jgi:hypothetical protein